MLRRRDAMGHRRRVLAWAAIAFTAIGLGLMFSGFNTRSSTAGLHVIVRAPVSRDAQGRVTIGEFNGWIDSTTIGEVVVMYDESPSSLLVLPLLRKDTISTRFLNSPNSGFVLDDARVLPLMRAWLPKAASYVEAHWGQKGTRRPVAVSPGIGPARAAGAEHAIRAELVRNTPMECLWVSGRRSDPCHLDDSRHSGGTSI